ncbi:TatD family hydrolase [Halomonas urumqiensis]|uniref:TatD family deoxyribonuclease n=1 Tax=Halomonas urumqiensis TaxID=1684789 RepID=A0A2N7UQ01_9GAMM|nr:TatD family hydrolase [Halomonas urumqiensis]PMR82518.1 TatD family deoxyribonuclease [Halomonas urumqiensis]PTB04131.1 TatD family deoxyribonuclease [Halomonas urumqiensis]GHE19601.1 putative metal-dependent hydrolase YjjV [Halomonas urumqiensis]
MLIDAHCHMDFPAFDADRDAVFARARAVGVGRFVVPGTTRLRWPDVLALGKRTDVSVCLGLHPYFMDEHQDGDIEALAQALEANPEIVALGECGIDGRFTETLEAQWVLFDAQLRLAKRRSLPVVIHCVRANDQIAKRLRQLDMPAGGLIHAFAGSLEQARRFLALGFTLGLGGAVTHPRAKRLRRTVAALPDDAFMLETDSPDMPLAGHQGERNEPSRIAEVCRVVAELRGQTPAQVAASSTASARRLLGIDQ